MQMSLRSWATPLTIGAFLTVSVTGVLMFFHLDTGLGKVAHEWLSWALVAGALAHLWLNRRALSTYFKRPVAVTIMGAGLVLLVTSLLIPAGGSDVPVRQVLGSLTGAPISALAGVVGMDPAVLVSSLAQDYPGVRVEQSLTDLAGGNPELALQMLTEVYAQTPPD